MAGQLNPQIIMGAVGNAVPLNDLASVYNNAANFRTHQMKLEQAEEETRQNQALNAAYKVATNPDGSVDQQKLMTTLAQSDIGAKIPAVQKANQEMAAKQAEIMKTRADTGKSVQEVLFNGLRQVDNSIASLASNPATTDRDVFSEMARLVNAGAFNVQAQHAGKSPDEYAREMLSTMPVGNPEGLKKWLIQSGMRVADATKRMEMMLPKYDEQDRGGQINEGTVNLITGQRTAGKNVQKTNTPGELLSAQVTTHGQDIKATTDRQANEISREASNSQVVETPQGYQLVNKGTGVARPVMQEAGNPVLGKDSSVAKNAQMADRMSQLIPAAKELLSAGPTASGSGAAADKMLNFLGYSTKGADRAMALEALSGWMTSNVPRFEGPQSDKDTETYKIMAGMVGDRTKPISTRLEALGTVEKIVSYYGGQRDLPFSGPPGTQPATMVAPRPAVPGPYSGPDRRGAPAGAAPAQRPSLDSFYSR